MLDMEKGSKLPKNRYATGDGQLLEMVRWSHARAGALPGERVKAAGGAATFPLLSKAAFPEKAVMGRWL